MVFLILVLVEVLRAATDRLAPRRHAAGISRRHRADGRHAGRQPVRRLLRVAAGTAAEERSPAGRREAHAQRRADVLARCWARCSASGPAIRCSTRWRRCSSPASSATPAGASRRKPRGFSSDEMMMDERQVRDVVQSVAGVLGCEKIRTRGSADYVFLDLHLWLDRAHSALHGPRDLARRERQADGEVSATDGRRHSHRAPSCGQLIVPTLRIPRAFVPPTPNSTRPYPEQDPQNTSVGSRLFGSWGTCRFGIPLADRAA